ncbi:MAG: DMT family transporter [Clostridiales Family XIII bacterium]|jgi:drug/metabolite transporter (DMT)-like permease|nr:DMT family transporter [Clostridiales Family XIII bacterium]
MNRKELQATLCLFLTALIWGLSFVAQVVGMESMGPHTFNAVRFTIGAVSLLPVILIMGRMERTMGMKGMESLKSLESLGGLKGVESVERVKSVGGMKGVERVKSLKSMKSMTSMTSMKSLTSMESMGQKMSVQGDSCFNGKDVTSVNVGIRKTILLGVVCGGILFVASALQQIGILYSGSAGKAGFVTGLYIIIVPIVGIFMRKKVGASTWIGALCAVFGLYLLCVTDGFTHIAFGDILLFIGAFFWAAHIIVVDTIVHYVKPLTLSFMQFVVCALFSAIAAFATEDVVLSGIVQGYIPILYAGICSVGIAYTLQIIGQKYVPPTKAAIIFSLEALFAAIGGAVIMHEVMSIRGYIGCAMIFVGIILAQLPSKKKYKQE